MNKRWRKIKTVSVKRTRIFTKYLKIRLEKPYTIILAALFPFLQEFLASIISIFTNGDNTTKTNVSLFGVSALYYLAFAMNTKRAAKGSWLGLVLLIMFGGLGIVAGKLFIKSLM